MKLCCLSATLAFLIAISFSVGCTGSAAINYVALDMKEIDPPPAEAMRFDADECYWWIDEDTNELCVSMRCVQQKFWLGKYGRTEMLTSWVLGDPPAGSGRNYKIGPRETLTVFHTVLQSTLVGSYAGIVGLLMDDDNNIHGSFRIWTKPRAHQVTLSLLPHDKTSYLCFGTFEAVRNPERGKAIRNAVERFGGVRAPRLRTPPSATQPAGPPVPASQPSDQSVRSRSGAPTSQPLSSRR